MIELKHEGFRLGLLPEAGGSVAWFRKDAADILRPAAAPFSAAPGRLNIAAFPLPPPSPAGLGTVPSPGMAAPFNCP